MTQKDSSKIDLTGVFTRFPAIGEDSELKADKTNPAIRLYGRRFYKDQTPVEYLAEFLLVFASPKNEQSDDENNGSYQLKIDPNNRKIPCYYPQDRVALKLFAFFPSSKLETRHPAHRQAYLDALETIKECLTDSNDEDKDETIKLIQSLLNGFVGVAKNRTWVTYSFLPASTDFLSYEVTWQHPQALKKSKKIEVIDWESSKHYFDQGTRNFLGRGGELLFLQLANLLNEYECPEIVSMLSQEEYKHLDFEVVEIIKRLEKSLEQILKNSVSQLGKIVEFIENKLTKYKLNEKPRPSNLGWVPVASRLEALLFAKEMDNICISSSGALEKLELLQTLCCMQVLRSLCFQARRIDKSEKNTPGFIGHYTWIVTDSEAKTDTPIRKMAQSSFGRIEAMLYRALRSKKIFGDKFYPSDKDLKNGDDNGFRHFRKFAKEIGLVIPKTGGGQRFTLHQGLLRFLVAALIKPGERIRLNHFYQRVFSHYGIALGGQELAIALAWSGNESGGESYAISANTAWIEEALQQGGFLVELSDAVSIVHNPR
jgi:hypothetical protein